MIKGLIFDFDGMILDTETPEYAAWQEVYADHGCELPLRVWTEHIGTSWESFDPLDHLEQLLGRPVDRESVDSARRARNRELLELEQIRPGVAEYFQAAKRLEIPVAIASSSPGDWVCGHMERLGVIKDISLIICSENVENVKPSPEVYNAALAALNIPPYKAIAFEDSPNGILAAKRAGIYCVAIPNPLMAKMNLDKADLQLKSLTDLSLEKLLESLQRQEEEREKLFVLETD